MKKNIVLIIIALCSVNFSNAQTSEGEVTVTAGLGYSLGMNIIKRATNVSLDAAGLEKIKSVPIINVGADYGITSQFSLGIAYSYHQWTWTDNFYDTVSNVSAEGAVKALRHNIGARGLFHFGNSDQIDIYTGARVGASVWNFSAEGSNSEGESASDFSAPGAVFSVQALFGVRAYFNDFVGAYFEFGLGTAPYMIGGGLSFRFGR